MVTESNWQQAGVISAELGWSRRLAIEEVALGRAAGRVLAADVGLAPNEQADARDGQEPLAPGHMLTPLRLALAASMGRATVRVSRRPSVALYTVGAQLAPPGVPLSVGQRYDSTRELLAALARADGVDVTAWPRLPDDRVQLQIAIRDAACAFDVVVICGAPLAGPGGVESVVREFGQLAYPVDRSEPRCPAALGWIDRAAILAVPDDHALALRTWLQLGRPLIDGLQGRVEARQAWWARLASPVPTRAAAIPVDLRHDETARILALPLGNSPAALATAAGWIFPSRDALEVGDLVQVVCHGY